MEIQRWTDWDMCGFAGYYSGRIISAPQMKITDILQEYENDCKATKERIEASKNLVKPVVISSVCTCTISRETPMINGKHICSICNKPIVQTDL